MPNTSCRSVGGRGAEIDWLAHRLLLHIQKHTPTTASRRWHGPLAEPAAAPVRLGRAGGAPGRMGPHAPHLRGGGPHGHDELTAHSSAPSPTFWPTRWSTRRPTPRRPRRCGRRTGGGSWRSACRAGTPWSTPWTRPRRRRRTLSGRSGVGEGVDRACLVGR